MIGSYHQLVIKISRYCLSLLIEQSITSSSSWWCDSLGEIPFPEYVGHSVAFQESEQANCDNSYLPVYIDIFLNSGVDLAVPGKPV